MKIKKTSPDDGLASPVKRAKPAQKEEPETPIEAGENDEFDARVRMAAQKLDGPAQLRYSKPGTPVQPGALPLAADTSYAMTGVNVLNFATGIDMKHLHGDKPVLVLPTGYILIEQFRATSGPVTEFVTALAEPVSRPEYIQEFQITVFSLYGAIAVGMEVEEIIITLNRFSKNHIPFELVNTIIETAKCFGKVKLVLKHNRYHIEADRKEYLEEMLKSDTIRRAKTRTGIQARESQTRVVDGEPIATATKQGFEFDVMDAPNIDDAILQFSAQGGECEEEELLAKKRELAKTVFGFEVNGDNIQAILESALNEVSRPLVMEYDFKRDSKNPDLIAPLKANTRVRYYQERALRKVFGNGRAQSGMIVLPCGAGKTLVGITAASTIGKSTMILTSSNVAVDQWRRSFSDFTNVDPSVVLSLTSDNKKKLPPLDTACVVCTSYTMISYSGRRSAQAEKIMDQIRERDWGLLIFDEVQFAPAPAFRKINDLVRSHSKLGLTATLVREDDLIYDLQWLIGPKLYEANWLELQKAGFLAKVQCCEVWCHMTSEFFWAYIHATPTTQRKLWVLNPTKLRVCEYLIKYHEARGDKVIVFSDSLFALKEVALAIRRPFICGEVSLQERMILLNKFKTSKLFNTIFLSKVGDNAIDIPCASVVIQISFNFASRRQEAQRLGRILRPKPATAAVEEFNAFFYSLVSKDTAEVAFADRRQQFIIDQGYAYKLLPDTTFPLDDEDLIFSCPNRQNQILRRILAEGDTPEEEEKNEVALNDADVDKRELMKAIRRDARG